MLKNEQDAQDAVQETVIRYFLKAPPFLDREHEKAWLPRVATNKCRDLQRFRVRHPLLDPETLETRAPDPTDSGILEALAALPEKYRLVLTLYYVEEYRIGDIANIIRRTSSAVKMRLQKGRKLLEEIYRKEYL
jgi:RNA polymerase sigma-70 factor (ECF subfamily)